MPKPMPSNERDSPRVALSCPTVLAPCRNTQRRRPSIRDSSLCLKPSSCSRPESVTVPQRCDAGDGTRPSPAPAAHGGDVRHLADQPALARIRMSARLSTATPARPTSPRDMGSSESPPIRIGISKAVDRPSPPASSKAWKRRLVSSFSSKAGELAELSTTLTDTARYIAHGSTTTDRGPCLGWSIDRLELQP